MADVATHRVPLGRGWSLWKWFAIRGAGFPIDDILRLADSDSAVAVDRLLACDDEERTTVEHALAGCHAARAIAAKSELRAWDKVVKAIRARRIPPAPPSQVPVLSRLADAFERRDRAFEETQRLLEVGGQRTSEFLRQVAADSRFREAMLWQNRQALRNVMRELSHAGPNDRSYDVRRSELVLASYLQRYCTKNDTIGFFGPIGWAEIESVASGIDVVPGRELVDRRAVFYEYWCIAALGDALASDPELRPWARPRRRGTIRIEGDLLHHTLDRVDQLPSAFARALALCDGALTAHAIAEQLAAQTELELEGVDDALGVLEELAEKRLINWTFEVPNRAEQLPALFEQELSAIEGPGRERAFSAFRALDAARAEVALAAGDPERLDRALGAFDECFTRLTGRDTVRNAGKTYGARTLLYEDCRRSGTMTLSPSLLRDALGTSLPLVLTSARWYTWEVARHYRSLATNLFRSMRAEGSTSTVDYLPFFAKLSDHFSADPRSLTRPVAEAQAELHRRWMEILALDPAQHRIHVSGATIAESVERAFAVPSPGWRMAVFHSPDLMIAATDVDAIRRGECEFVIGEVHTGELTLFNPFHRIHHPTPEALIAARELDVAQPIVSHLVSKERTTRVDGDVTVPRDFHVITGSGRSWLEGQMTASELVLEEHDGTLWVRTLDGRHRFEVDEFFAFFLDANSSAQFKLLPRLPHLPRVTLDRLVLAHESWSFDPAQLPFVAAKGNERYIEARRWARSVGLPRFVFTKVAEEPKPSYVDFESPISVELFAKQLVGASAVQVTEMLPGPNQAWLPDAEGRRYVCELRMGALDSVPWHNPT